MAEEHIHLATGTLMGRDAVSLYHSAPWRRTQLSSPGQFSFRVRPSISVLPFNRFVTSNSFTQRS
jgi:hypothetical protein